MADKYILDDTGNAIPVENTLEWAKWIEENHDRWSQQDEIGRYSVNTSFFGVNMDIRGQVAAIASGGNYTATPLLWETLLLAPGEIITQERCATWEQAKKHHAEAVAIARAAAAAHKPKK